MKLGESAADETFWYFSGRSSNEAGFLLQLFARLYGTNNVNNCSYYCHQASGVGLTSSIGTGTATVELEDVEHADLVFLIGGNPASNHPRLMTTLKQVRRRGGEVIVINPVREVGLVNFRIPSDPHQPPARDQDRHAVCAAAYRRGSGVVDRHRQANRRVGSAGREFLAATLRWL